MRVAMSGRRRFVAPSGGVPGVIKVLDNFTDTNGTSLDAHTPDTDVEAGGWTEQAGQTEIQTNQARPASDGVNHFSTIESGISEVLITATVSVSQDTVNDVEGIIGRWSDASNFWFVGITAQANLFRIFERNGGSNIERASASVTIGASTPYEITATFNSTTITAQLDGGNEISYSSASLNQTATIHGFRAFRTGGYYAEVDTIQMETI